MSAVILLSDRSEKGIVPPLGSPAQRSPLSHPVFHLNHIHSSFIVNLSRNNGLPIATAKPYPKPTARSRPLVRGLLGCSSLVEMAKSVLRGKHNVSVEKNVKITVRKGKDTIEGNGVGRSWG